MRFLEAEIEFNMIRIHSLESTMYGGESRGRQKLLIATPEALLEVFKCKDRGVTFSGLPDDIKVVAARYNEYYERFEIAVESASFPETAPRNPLVAFDIAVTVGPSPESATILLREVHQNNLDGFLYSGPIRERVARFLGMPDLCSNGDGNACLKEDQNTTRV